MNQAQYDAALATLTAELESESDERTKEKLVEAIAKLKDYVIDEEAPVEE